MTVVASKQCPNILNSHQREQSYDIHSLSKKALYVISTKISPERIRGKEGSPEREAGAKEQQKGHSAQETAQLRISPSPEQGSCQTSSLP